MCNTSCIMCQRQLLLGKEILQAALLILKVSERLIANSSKTVPLADKACKEESTLKEPPLSLVAFFFWGGGVSVWFFPSPSFQTSKEDIIIKQNCLEKEASFPLCFKCSIKDFTSTSISKVSHKMEPLLRAHIVLLLTNSKQARIP